MTRFSAESAIGEIMDATVSPETQHTIRQIASSIEDVSGVEKMRIRKSGLGLLMDIHVQVDGTMSVTKSHEIAHRVKDRLLASGPQIQDVVVHIEPKPQSAA
jgi:divalent metal cation (Fe/Co/Zn/Cd) transporter